MMTFDAWLTLATTGTCVALMVFSSFGTERILIAGATLLLLAGVIEVPDFLAGLSNTGMVTVALMYVLVTGIRQTGGVETIVRHILGRPRTMTSAMLRTTVPVLFLSAFINNTPVVATFIPAVMTWARRMKLPLSHLLLPLSYAAMLGGTCTLIGTSTNLIVHAMLVERHPEMAMGMFDLAWIGIPVAVSGLLYMLAAHSWLLPARDSSNQVFGNPKEYTIEMEVEPNGPLAGKTIEQAGLRHLGDVYLVEIERGQSLLPAVSPKERLQANDRLVFAGSTHSAIDLQQIKGLRPSTQSGFNLAPHPERCIVEAVVSPQCALLGQTIRDGQFRTLYGAAVLAVCRNGQKVDGNLGQVRLQPADTLLLETQPAFVDRYRQSREFLLVSELDGQSRPQHHKAWQAWAILAGVVIAASIGQISLFKAVLAGAAAMLATGCCSWNQARRSLDGTVLLTIAASFALGRALKTSGVSVALAQQILQLAQDPNLLLATTFGLVALLTAVITNNAAAVLVFPIIIALTDRLQLNPVPFVVVLMIAASSSFATPIGYQTNLMVYGPGGYRFRDYLIFGGGLTILVGILTVWLVPLIWPL